MRLLNIIFFCVLFSPKNACDYTSYCSYRLIAQDRRFDFIECISAVFQAFVSCQSNEMGKVHMLHPSSGRVNFDSVPAQVTNNNSSAEASKTANSDEQDRLAADKQDLVEKTKNAIDIAAASASQTASNNATNS
ncbi:unnamed protein product [Adineta ricciae]|uniref:Uncharacterized protein n=1 Tax=Adineta ricciae TaxID=249248 RepID=A0A813NL28_ADIRI|nr:unnamed protein product [Adineta ricciae]CAF1281967.1 unnamed protein product [Adineta ricciae]